ILRVPLRENIVVRIHAERSDAVLGKNELRREPRRAALQETSATICRDDEGRLPGRIRVGENEDTVPQPPCAIFPFDPLSGRE
ncbi:hypothetical protein, partial [Klebsiella pneumoniae]|uniref:hypothetical protein n=1 Tax=Klebsiella pneumoniae TaxID=573 RepID=UPI001C206EF3